MIFDLKAVWDSRDVEAAILTLGYNTALFNTIHLVYRRRAYINMDGIEWKRQKWGVFARCWLWLNERLATRIADVLIADHPGIRNHLEQFAPAKKIRMIPYGAESVLTADTSRLEPLGLLPGNYLLIVARPEPENSIVELVSAFSKKTRRVKLVVLGDIRPEQNSYHRKIIEGASEEVVFPGAIYEPDTVRALRFFARVYLHGHQIGGTNPSLVEALGAGCAVLAHDNQFNRWVSGEAARYFADQVSAERQITKLCASDEEVDRLKQNARAIFMRRFVWDDILKQYEQMLSS